MIVTVERVSTFNLRNLLGYDCPQEFFDAHVSGLSRSTMVWLARADGVEACAAGLIPATIFSTEAYLWMIHTRICEQHPLRFIRWSKRLVDEILEFYPSVVGLCHCDNIYGRRWLEWLGGEFDGSRTHNGHMGFRIS